ncbi:LysR family transcriptional regulator [Azohydromonas australica]|uniref:LysR family transcriptional regulator n=1 Tax=Azohydromonas australica TaxID=364039 RepID=UPI000408A7DC|nr:LysR family transcriptional regulator [Azohydromonas australica]
MPINELRSIATFVKAAELGSLRRAAQAQSMTPQAASQALAQLEQHLGVRLFHRTTRSIALTDEGQRFLETAQPALTALQRALQTVRQAKDDIAGPLRIVGPHSAFVSLLWPVIDEFCTLYPEVQPDVFLDDRIGDWVQDRVDVGFRIGLSLAAGLIARRLFPLQLIICAAPAYLSHHGVPDNLYALASHRCGVFRQPGTGKLLPWHVKIDDEVIAHEVAPALCTNDIDMELEAVLSGRVVGQLMSMSAAAHIRSGRLVPLLTQHVADHLGVFLYYGNRTAQPARARAFIDLAIERLAGNPAFVMTEIELKNAEAAGRKAHARH